jgi:CRISPR-associated protein Cas1
MNDERALLKKGEAVLITENKEKIAQLPIHNLEGIVLFGDALISSALIELANENHVHISFIGYAGKFRAKLISPTSGNVRLRRDQYRFADNHELKLILAKNFVFGKIYNSSYVLKRAIRDHSEKIDIDKIKRSIVIQNRVLKRIERCKDEDQLRGVEGEAGRAYFGVFEQLILNTNPFFRFNGRSRRPPLDAVNCLISFFYTLLAHDVESALETVGLDPQVGFLHAERSGKSALAYDLMEELRAYMVDRFVITLINNRQVSEKDFSVQENGAVLLTDDARKSVLQAWQKRKYDVMTHPYLKEKVEVGLLPYIQALILARFIRGDIDVYPAFLAR